MRLCIPFRHPALKVKGKSTAIEVYEVKGLK